MQYCERLRNSCKKWNIEVWIMLSEDVSPIKKPQSFLLYMSRSSPSISCVWIIRFYFTTWNAIRQAWILLKCKGSCAQHFVFDVVWHTPIVIRFTGGNRAKLPSSRWRRRGRSLREVFACSRLFATIDLFQICNRVTRWHGTPCTKTTDAYPFSFLYNNLRKIRRETTVGEKPGRR